MSLNKIELLKQVSAEFKTQPYVDKIEIIPSSYLKPKGGFNNVDQLKRLFGIDVICLVSYDQVQFTDKSLLSLSYWTIIGAYIVPGELNDTNTLLDSTVFDITSRQLLFRAPGFHHLKGRSTLVQQSSNLRVDSNNSYKEAVKIMISNLKNQVEEFKARVKEKPDTAKIVETKRYKELGGGSIVFPWFFVVLFTGVFYYWKNRKVKL